METILEPDAATFPFDQLALTAPIMLSSGNYFIKYSLHGKSVYIQPPKCRTKQGIMKAGKKLICDLLFTNENEAFVQWIEQLEQISQQKIFENRSKWFESDLEMHDIENSFTSSLKIYKSGKFYILKTIVPTRLGKCSLNIYDEAENSIDIATVNDQSNIVTILEVQGIRCSARNFQIDIEIKQMMIIKPEKIFERCVISLGNSRESKDALVVPEVIEPVVPEMAITVFKEDVADTTESIPTIDVSLGKINSPIETVEVLEEDGIQIVDVTVDDIDTDSIHIKSRNEVYYGIYKQALQKANSAKKLALHAYLEAKQIRQLYKLDESDIEDLLDGDVDYEDAEYIK